MIEALGIPEAIGVLADEVATETPILTMTTTGLMIAELQDNVGVDETREEFLDGKDEEEFMDAEEMLNGKTNRQGSTHSQDGDILTAVMLSVITMLVGLFILGNRGESIDQNPP